MVSLMHMFCYVYTKMYIYLLFEPVTRVSIMDSIGEIIYILTLCEASKANEPHVLFSITPKYYAINKTKALEYFERFA